jgi:hypothetical protein
MTRFFRHPWGWATVAPLACAIHCAVTPVLVIAAPNLVPGTTVEWALLSIAVVVGLAALSSGVRAHEDLRPAVPVVLGLGLWTLSLLHLFHPAPEDLTTVAATLIVAGGLLWNSRLHCARRDLVCQACAVADAESPSTSLGGSVPAPGVAAAAKISPVSSPALKSGSIHAA